MSKHNFDYDLIVIGSGAAGSIAVDIVARTGQKVAIVEAGNLGGSAPMLSDVPVGALMTAAHTFDEARRGAAFGLRTTAIGYNYPSIKNWKDLAVRRSGVAATSDYLHSRGVSLFKGRAHFISPHEISIGRRHLSAEKFLIATGTHVFIPDIAGLDAVDYLTTETAIDLLKPPRSLFVVGAGAAGVQLAELFAIFGTKVYLADVQKRILAHEDDEVSEVMTDVLTRLRGMEVLTSARVIAVKNENPYVRVTCLTGEAEHSVKVEKVLIATGRTPNVDIGLENAGVEYDKTGIKTDEFLTTSARNIYAAGDILGRFGKTHSALYEGRVAANNLLGQSKTAANYTAIPRVIWTSPEVAAVGMTEKDLAREDIKFHRSIVQNSVTPRANIANFAVGFAKVLSSTKGELLGATIVAPHAAETINEISLAISRSLAVHDIASTIHPFGSWSEALRLACAKVRIR
ncbi:MAG: NAD(P)/FAD-dependent oxidoreductase [Candidatus Nomurabacteria bacterium]|jgi:pyruvate/2-oxoglutarate dehydrogenase complex dihydrolipoamide dehydrogenase (E3) component|nr:NAD(P)/FAD-dependent oxidoreductase [Candidatus Nomurabacteria bacterium]